MSTNNQYDGDTPDLADLIQLGAEATLAGFYAALVAAVVEYDATAQTAKVQPVAQVLDADGGLVTFPPISGCAVLFPAGGGFSLTWPLSVGDACLVVFSTVALSQWLASGDTAAAPESPRRGSLSDGIVIPGVRPTTGPLLAPQGTGLALGLDDGTAGLVLSPGGAMDLKGTAIKVNAGAHPVAAGDLIQAELVKIATSLASIPAPTPYVAPVSAALVSTDDLTSD